MDALRSLLREWSRWLGPLLGTLAVLGVAWPWVAMVVLGGSLGSAFEDHARVTTIAGGLGLATIVVGPHAPTRLLGGVALAGAVLSLFFTLVAGFALGAL